MSDEPDFQPVSRTVEILSVRGAMVAVVLYVSGKYRESNGALADELADVLLNAVRESFGDVPSEP